MTLSINSNLLAPKATYEVAIAGVVFDKNKVTTQNGPKGQGQKIGVVNAKNRG